MLNILLVTSVVCLIGLVLLTVLTVTLWIEVRAMTKSTHQVQFVRSGEYEQITEELKEKLSKDLFDNI